MHPYGGCSVSNWNLFQPYLRIVCDVSYILKDRWQKSLLQLTWWKIVNIRPFCWLRNECVCFVPVNNTVTVFQIYKAYISLHIYCLIFLYSYRFRWYFLQWVVSDFCFCGKKIIGSTEKVFSKALLVFKMDQRFWIIWFILGSVRLHVTVSGNTWAFCVVYGVSKSFLSRSLFFLTSVSNEESHNLFL